LPVWIIISRVHEAARITAFHIALERGRKMDGCRNSAGCGINRVAGVNGQSFNSHLQMRLRFPVRMSIFPGEDGVCFRFDGLMR